MSRFEDKVRAAMDILEEVHKEWPLSVVTVDFRFEGDSVGQGILGTRANIEFKNAKAANKAKEDRS